jgi:hypothetical protein
MAKILRKAKYGCADEIKVCGMYMNHVFEPLATTRMSALGALKDADQLSMIEMNAEQLHDNITSRIKNDTNYFHCKGLICPITKKLTIDPVVGSDRTIYERNAFIKHCSDKSKTPVFSQVPTFIKEMISGYKRGIVYLVKPNKKENVIIISEGTDTGKLGYSQRSGFTRLKQYGSNATVLCVVQCDYYWMMEAQLKKAFVNEFDCLPKTKESFNGNLQAMQNLWLSVVSMMTTDLRSLDKKLICKFQQQQNGLPPRPQVPNANSDVPSLKRKREDVDTEECVDVYLVEHVDYHETNTLELSVMELGVNLAVQRQTDGTNTICYVQRACPGVLQELINEFDKEFTHVKENKYFKGNPQDMRVRWLSIVSNKILSSNNGSCNLYSQQQFKKQKEECKKKERKQAKLTPKQAKLTKKQLRAVETKQSLDFWMKKLMMKSSQSPEDGQSPDDIRGCEGFKSYNACCEYNKAPAAAHKSQFKQYLEDCGHKCTKRGHGRTGGNYQITGLRFNPSTVETKMAQYIFGNGKKRPYLKFVKIKTW